MCTSATTQCTLTPRQAPSVQLKLFLNMIWNSMLVQFDLMGSTLSCKTECDGFYLVMCKSETSARRGHSQQW